MNPPCEHGHAGRNYRDALEALGALAAFLSVMQAGAARQMPASDDPPYRQATTACLPAIVLAQMVNLFV